MVPAHRLLSKNTLSCGSNRKSHGEIEIENFLKEKQINFISEYSFDNLRSPNSNKKLRFDFAIFKNNNLDFLLEYDGEQHFKPIEYFGGQEEYIKRTIYDNLKFLYCQNHNIPLYRIYYNKETKEELNKILKERNFL